MTLIPQAFRLTYYFEQIVRRGLIGRRVTFSSGAYTVDFDNSSYGKRSICILACVFAVDFGNRVIPGFGLYRCLRQDGRPTNDREGGYD
jgi:hypothetical protein